MAGVGGCPNVGGICIGCTMPGFPDKFMQFMDQPPGSLLSSQAAADRRRRSNRKHPRYQTVYQDQQHVTRICLSLKQMRRSC
jgi:Ni,Fe-hydrogenase I small subunit